MRPGVAIESSRSRCHSGWSISAATWSAIPASTGLPVSSAMRRWKSRSDSFQPWRAAGSRRDRRRPPSRPAGARTRASGRPRSAARRAIAGSSSARASSRSLGLASCGSRARGGQALGGVGGHERAGAGPRLDHALDLQRGDRLAHGGAADLEPARELALGRQPLAGREGAGADLGREPLGHVLVALQRPRPARRPDRIG